jgi:hypothetical protein
VKLNPFKGLKSITRQFRATKAKSPTGAPIKAAIADAQISLAENTKLFDGKLNKKNGHWEPNPKEPNKKQATTGKKLTRTNTPHGNLGRPMLAQAPKTPPSPKRQPSPSESKPQVIESAVPYREDLSALDKDIVGLQSLSTAIESGTYGLHIIHAALEAHDSRISPEEQSRFDALFKADNSEAYRTALDNKCKQLKELRNGASAAQLTQGLGASTVEAPQIEISKETAITVLGNALDAMLNRSPSEEELKTVHQRLQSCQQHVDTSAWKNLTVCAERGEIGLYAASLGAILEELEG